MKKEKLAFLLYPKQIRRFQLTMKESNYLDLWFHPHVLCCVFISAFAVYFLARNFNVQKSEAMLRKVRPLNDSAFVHVCVCVCVCV